MLFTEKLAEKNRRMIAPPVTAVFLGDSVTHGCFEMYDTPAGGYACVFDHRSVYHSLLRDAFAAIFPQAPLNVVNAGLSADTAAGGLRRYERDALRYAPDLTVVAYGMNDAVAGGLPGLDAYRKTLESLLSGLRRGGGDVVFMTENMLATYVAPDVGSAALRLLGEKLVETQNGGVLDAYFDGAAEVCAELGVPVCDCYAVWKRMHALGADIPRLLANRLNHPARPLHRIFSDSLFALLMK